MQTQIDSSLSSLITAVETRDLQAILNCIAPAAHSFMTMNSDFRSQFASGSELDAVVLAIDIRRSTELMLKAKSAQDYADFVSELCTGLRQLIIDNFGVFDKFTGDGVLASFPSRYSGEDAIGHALHVGMQAHGLFAELYKTNRARFTTVLKSVGLGVGIDYGKVTMLRIGGALTAVGRPVVYACRLSGAPTNTTALNQQAYDIAAQKFAGYVYFEEITVPLKHEGEMLAYSAHLATKLSPQRPGWAIGIGGDAQPFREGA